MPLLLLWVQLFPVSLFRTVETSWVVLIGSRPVARTHSVVEVFISASSGYMISAIRRPADVSRRLRLKCWSSNRPVMDNTKAAKKMSDTRQRRKKAGIPDTIRYRTRRGKLANFVFLRR